VPRRLLTAAAGALAALACAAPAHAATVSIESTHHYLVVKGGPARDDLTVSAGKTAGGLTVVAHAGGPLGPAPHGCASAGPGSVTCAGPLAGVYVDGSGGNDSLTVTVATPSASFLLGGGGDDVLRGGPGRDFLSGGKTHVRVKLSRNGRRRIIRRKRARCSVVARAGNRTRTQSIVVHAARAR
jgi:opacity protein-like surface antigen